MAAVGASDGGVDIARRALQQPQSDLLTIVATFEEFENAALSGGRASERRLCDKYLLSYDTLCEYRELRRSFVQQLTSAGLVADKSPEKNGNEAEGRPLAGGAECNRHRANRNLVAAVLAAGLYPNLATTASSPVSTAALFAGIVPASAGDASFGGGGSGGGSALEWFCGRRGGAPAARAATVRSCGCIATASTTAAPPPPADTSPFEKRKTGGHSEEQQRRQPPTLHESSASQSGRHCDVLQQRRRVGAAPGSFDGRLAQPRGASQDRRAAPRPAQATRGRLREVARAPLEAKQAIAPKIIDTVASI